MNPNSSHETDSTYPRGRLLRWALLANAVFSGSTGAFLLLFPDRTGALLGLGSLWILPVIGVGLLVFGVDLIWQATRPRLITWRAFFTSLADLVWVVASAVLLIFFSALFSATGSIIIGVVAAIVLTLALFQLWGIALAHQSSPGKYTVCVPVEVDVPLPALWEAVGDLGAIASFADNLVESKLSSSHESTVGTVRTCRSTDGKAWSEECIEYQPQAGYRVRFLTDEPGFPFPVKTMEGGWKVFQMGSEKTLVHIYWEFTLHNCGLAPFLIPMLALQVETSMPKVVGQMAAKVSGEDRTDAKPPRFRLFPRPC